MTKKLLTFENVCDKLYVLGNKERLRKNRSLFVIHYPSIPIRDKSICRSDAASRIAEIELSNS